MRHLVFVLATCAAIAACARAKSDAARGDASSDASTGMTSADLSVDAGADGARFRGEIVEIAATNQVSVCDRPAWPESNTGARRLGYLRHGAVVRAYESALINEECREGWFELEDGKGWVCSKYATVDLDSPRIRLAPHQPDRDAGMPYKYGVNLSDGTPLYRRVLAVDDRKKFEPQLAKPVAHEEEGEGESGDPAAAGDDTKEDDATDVRDAGAPDAAKEKPKLRDLRGRGVLVRKLSRGFYLALDREFKAAGARWWRTSFGFAVPFDKIMVQPGVTKYAGNWFSHAPFADGAEAAGTVMFVRHHASVKITLSDDAKKVTGTAELPSRSAVLLTGRTEKVGGVTYHETSEGFFVQMASLVAAKPSPPPADLAPDEKWIDVDLTRQALVAFEGTRPVFATLVSSGRRNAQDKEKDFPTPTGTFRIREKHVTTTMDGDVASDGPYSIDDVPWVQYFQGSYALHGAFWHDTFGYVRSHGCVNLAPEDSRALFAWSDPVLPVGWHGVFAEPDKGTRILIHEDAPVKK